MGRWCQPVLWPSEPTPTTISQQARSMKSPTQTGIGPVMNLAPALDGERMVFDGVSCYIAGRGPPMVLVHSVNAAPSAAEMRPVFEHYSSSRTVFAIDLPGFGLSDRSDRLYDPRLMTDALHALSSQVQMRCGAVPIDAMAASLGCEFLARAAAEQPARWGRLAFVSPTGLNGTTARRGSPGSTRAMPWLHALLSARPWARTLYRGLTHPTVIRYFLQRTWGSKAIDESLWAYDVRTARQPGAHFAPLHFLSGGLFSQDIHRVYESLRQPVWMSHGVRGDFKDFRGRRLILDRGNWQTTVYPTGALPYFEVPSAFLQDFDAFLVGKAAERPADAAAWVGQRPAPA
jgi:pimeloyl-ACP methyl ester carboxylesterase